jgi:hypothetical protein
LQISGLKKIKNLTFPKYSRSERRTDGKQEVESGGAKSDHENSARGSRKSAIFSSNVGEEQDIREFCFVGNLTI